LLAVRQRTLDMLSPSAKAVPQQNVGVPNNPPRPSAVAPSEIVPFHGSSEEAAQAGRGMGLQDGEGIWKVRVGCCFGGTWRAG